MEWLCDSDREVWKGEKTCVEAWGGCVEAERSRTWDDVIFVIDIASVFLYYQSTAAPVFDSLLQCYDSQYCSPMTCGMS